MESLTQFLADEALGLIEEIREAGGMPEAISRGIPQRNIAMAAALRQAAIDEGREKIVGVNHLSSRETERLEIRKIDNREISEKQTERLRIVREHRDPVRLKTTLGQLRQGASDPSRNLLDLAIAAARERACS